MSSLLALRPASQAAVVKGSITSLSQALRRSISPIGVSPVGSSRV
jgi:hypothetical protein